MERTYQSHGEDAYDCVIVGETSKEAHSALAERVLYIRSILKDAEHQTADTRGNERRGGTHAFHFA